MRTAGQRKYTTLVLSSGGVRGVAIAGAVECLDVAGILKHITTYIGTSAGSIIAMLLALGYSATEVTKFAVQVDLWKTLGATISLSELISVHRKLGLIDSRHKMKTILRILIASSRVAKDCPNITFAEAFEKTGIRLVVCATNVVTSEAVYFDERRSPDMPIEKAIRASCAIPFAFMPVDNKFVDGAIAVPYPVKATADDAGHTLGVCVIDSCLSSPGHFRGHVLTRLVKYGYALVRTVEKMQLEHIPSEYRENTIRIECARGQVVGPDLLNTMLSIGKEAGSAFLQQSSRRTRKVLDTIKRADIERIKQVLRAKRACLVHMISQCKTRSSSDE